MAEELIISGNTRQEQYNSLLQSLHALTNAEPDMIANLANIAAAIKQTFGFLWVGFYRVLDEELVLGPFQGPIACTRIKKGEGVCGKAWLDNKTIVVPNVDEFEGHIACSSASKSEIVVPIAGASGITELILDIDSERLSEFDDVDVVNLETLGRMITRSVL